MSADSDSLRSVYDYAVAYVQAGFSVIPTPKGEKAARIRWARYQQAIADPSQITQWFNLPDPPNVALIMGRVSGNAVALDVDHAGFAAWLEEQIIPLIAPSAMPLCKRTGSGKLHLIFRSVEPITTSILPLPGTGETLADIKAEGGYVIAAPSLHPSGGTYRVLRGSIDQVPTVKNARFLFDRLARLYAEYLGMTSPAYLLKPKMQIIPPTEGEARDVLEKELRGLKLSSRLNRAILEGANADDADWHDRKSNSEIDYAITIALREREWSPERIEAVFATFPIGEHCYRNAQRDHHGTSWLTLTIANADKKRSKVVVNTEQIQGPDWKITNVTRTEFDPPKYEMEISCPDGVDRRLSGITTEDILSDKRMVAKLASVFASLPKFRSQHQGRGYLDFANAVMEMANREKVPTLATGTGFIQTLLQELMQSERIRKYRPEAPGDIAGGWLEDGVFYIVGRVAVQFVEQRVHGAHSEDVWEAARQMGAQDQQMKLFEGRTERVWVIPDKRPR